MLVSIFGSTHKHTLYKIIAAAQIMTTLTTIPMQSPVDKLGNTLSQLNINTDLRRDDDITVNKDTESFDDSATSTPTTVSDENEPQVFRFKLAPSVQEMVTAFAKVHQYDDRKDYKEAWNTWCEENTNAIRVEEERLSELGYDGNVIDKMYKAGRYYFRTKTVNKDKKAKKRRQYVSMDSSILIAMDEHIASNYNTEGYTPASGYDTFVESNKNILLTEVQRLFAEHGNNLNAKDIQLKVKKTYKNRYYLYSRNNQD